MHLYKSDIFDIIHCSGKTLKKKHCVQDNVKRYPVVWEPGYEENCTCCMQKVKNIPCCMQKVKNIPRCMTDGEKTYPVICR